MSHYVGLDISVKSVSICVVDARGKILVRGETTSDPDVGHLQARRGHRSGL